MINEKKVIGIIGGMGPMATADLFRKIIERTDAKCDNEHIHILIDNNTGIPDRTQAILSGSDAPAGAIAESAKRLEAMGADLLIIPCNTSHFFYPAIAQSVHIPILHMPEETAAFAAKKGIKTAALLATDGTVKSGIYHKAFEKVGIRIITPDESGQAKVMHMTYHEVKAGKKADINALEPTLDALAQQGAEMFILGCTELPVAFAGYDKRCMADPTMILAEAAIRAAGYRVKSNVQ